VAANLDKKDATSTKEMECERGPDNGEVLKKGPENHNKQKRGRALPIDPLRRGGSVRSGKEETRV